MFGHTLAPFRHLNPLLWMHDSFLQIIINLKFRLRSTLTRKWIYAQNLLSDHALARRTLGIFANCVHLLDARTIYVVYTRFAKGKY